MPSVKPTAIGITGGIGAGKSIVSKVFATLGIPIYDADTRARWLMNNDPELITKIKALLGNESYGNGTLNRKHIAAIAFKDESILQKLNNLVHPAVGQDFLSWQADQKAPYVLKEAALLFEAGSYKSLDKTITVTAPENVRIERVIKRDNRTKQEVKDILTKQWPEAKKIELSDYQIDNSGDKMVIPQVLGIHELLLHQIGR